MDLLSNKIRREQLVPGDHIYTWRRGYFYSHHGIFVGEGMVIHHTRGPGLIVFSSSPPNNSGDRVVRCRIEEFLSGGILYRYVYGISLARFLANRGGTCSHTPSNPPEDTLHRASFLLKHGFGDYNLFSNNCEDFATYCKTGLLKLGMSTPTRSEQIKFLSAVVCAVIFTPHTFLPTRFISPSLLFCGVYCVFRLTSNKGVENVEVERFDSRSRRDIWISEREKTWSLTTVDCIAYALMGLRFWSWTPASRHLLWIRLLFLYSMISNVLSNQLRKHKRLRLGEHIVYMIWVLAYSYWSSDGTIFYYTRLYHLFDILTLLLPDEGSSRRARRCMFDTMAVIGVWHWTPESTILQLFRFVSLLLLLFFAFLLNYDVEKHSLGSFLLICYVTPLLVLYFGIVFIPRLFIF